jgi:AcrR family transcriptional regulator
MGRPRPHGEVTRRALLDAAERMVEADGVDALSVRKVAEAVGTTTRAVYTIFGSKDGLLGALGAHAFELLGAAVDGLPVTDDPVADLVAAGAVAFRGFAIEHPALFRIGVQRFSVPGDVAHAFIAAAQAALGSLHARIDRLGSARTGERTVAEAAWEFHALCEGLAALELRPGPPAAHARQLWTRALRSLVLGWREPSSIESGPVQ